MSVVLPPNSSGTSVKTVTSGGFDTFCSVLSDGVAPTTNLASINAPGTNLVARLFELAVSSALVDGTKATYSAAVTGLLPTAAASTGLVILTGSATKTVRVTHILMSGTLATTAVYLDWQIAKYSTAASGGTAATMTAVPHDSNSVAATASISSYTGTGPTMGTLVGVIAVGKVLGPITGTPVNTPIFDISFGNRPAQCPVLRGVAQQLAILNNNVTYGTAPNLDISIEWTEE
jgi:hypothetical protein